MESSLGYSPQEGTGRGQVAGGGGAYLSVHLRRADYVYARPGKV